ncbi:MAG: hypothetical protein KC912_14045 [Proteobacteria bacterium]|nr:hypothetical protein [Pseudomonadota bacterium]
MRQFSSLLFISALCLPASAFASLSCSNTCVSGVQSQSGSFYDVFVDCSSGEYSVSTGASHPATQASGGFPQNVIYGGSTGSPGTSSLGVYFYGTGEHFSTSTETGAVTVTPLGTCTFDPTDTDSEVGSRGLETEWLLTDSAGNQYVWRHEVVTFGDSALNSGTRLTQSVTASAANEIGLRWQIDYESGYDDGPTFARVVCDPFSVATATSNETDFNGAQLDDFYQMINNDGITPVVENYTSTVHLGGFPHTETPDRVVYGSWPNLTGAVWAYTSSTVSADYDSAVLYYYGASRANAVELPESSVVARSMVLFNGVNADDCGEFEPIDTGGVIIDTGDTSEPVPSYYAGGCASCNTGSGSGGFMVLTLVVALVRRRGGMA